MNIIFRKVMDSDLNILIEWLTSDKWQYHGISRPDPEKIGVLFKEGYYNGNEAQTFWMILETGERVGLIRIHDLLDYAPMFDLRIRSSHRGKGLGGKALKWLTEYIFKTWHDKWRIEGQTRNDNMAMRHVFRKCGYVKEAHYRKAWPAPGDELYDSIGYGILREDWEEGKVTPVNWDDEEDI